MTTPDYWQMAELQREREQRIQEALGHIEAAGLIEEAATLRFELGIPSHHHTERQAPLWDGVSEPF